MGLFFVARMDINAVAEGGAFAGGNDEVAGLLVGEFFEIMATERIGCEQAVIAHVPPGGMTRVAGVVEDSDPDRFTVDGAIIIAPAGAFAPGGIVLDAFAIDDVAVTDLAFEAHGFGQADGHGAFLGIAEGNVGFWGDR